MIQILIGTRDWKFNGLLLIYTVKLSEQDGSLWSSRGDPRHCFVWTDPPGATGCCRYAAGIRHWCRWVYTVFNCHGVCHNQSFEIQPIRNWEIFGFICSLILINTRKKRHRLRYFKSHLDAQNNNESAQGIFALIAIRSHGMKNESLGWHKSHFGEETHLYMYVCPAWLGFTDAISRMQSVIGRPIKLGLYRLILQHRNDHARKSMKVGFQQSLVKIIIMCCVLSCLQSNTYLIIAAFIIHTPHFSQAQ